MRDHPTDGSRFAPPSVLRRVLRACLPLEEREALSQDLDGLFRSRVAARGRSAANAWYARQVLGFVARVGGSRLAESIGRPEAAMRHLRAATRALRRSPAFAMAFVLTLAIGVGVLATVYTAARWVLLRPVPGVRGAEHLVTLRLGSREGPPHVSWKVTHPDFLALRERLPLHGALAATTSADVDLRVGTGDPRRVAGAIVTSNYFAVLGGQMAAGRPFVSEEELSDADVLTTVLSFDLARRIAGSPASAVGQDVRINGTVVRVVGVAARGFRGDELPGQTELWLPRSARLIVDPSDAAGGTGQRANPLWRRMIARLPAGTAQEAGLRLVAASSNKVMRQLVDEHRWQSQWATHFLFQTFAGIGLDPGVRATVRRTLAVLGGAAAVLLWLAAANLANLAFIQSARRRKATAIRRALGAGRASLAYGVFAEAVLLALGSGLVAVGLAELWSVWFQGHQLSEHGGALSGMHVGVRVVAATMTVALVTAILVHARPAFSARFRSLEQLMRGHAAGGASARHGQSVLVAVQVALSLVLLVAAGLLGRTVHNLRDVDLGFEPDRLLMFSLDPHLHGVESEALQRLGGDLEGRLREEPGVDNAGFISPSPLRSSYLTAAVYPSDATDARPVIGAGFYVTSGLLHALQARVIAGERNWQADSGTAVISRSMWQRIAPGTNPIQAIGRLVATRRRGGAPVRVVAVIEDLRLSSLDDRPPLLFRPLAQRPPGLSLSGFVASKRRPAALAPAVLRTVSAMAPELPVFDVRTARAAVDLQFAERTAMAFVAATLGVIGVLLAAIGLYGVLADVVATRQRDIGIRAALGATPTRLVWDVVARALAPVAAGTIVGLGGSALVSKLLSAQLFGLEGFDGVAYWGGTAVLLVAAAAACLTPAYRATRVPPAEVLRAE